MKMNYKDYEILIVNDGSTDSTLQVSKELEQKIDQVRVVNQKNAGSGYARNAGLNSARGKYLFFHDADDKIIYENWLKVIESLMTVHPDVLVFSYNKINKNKSCRETRIPKVFCDERIHDNLNNYFFDLFENNLFAAVWNKVYSKELLVSNKIFFTNQSTGQDLLFNFNVFTLNPNVYFESSPCYNYIYHNTSSYNKYRPEKIVNELSLVKKLNTFFTDNKLDSDKATDLQQLQQIRLIQKSLSNSISEGSPLNKKSRKSYIDRVLEIEGIKKSLETVDIIKIFKKDKKLAIIALLAKYKMVSVLFFLYTIKK